MTKRTDKDVSGRGEGKPSPFIDTRVIFCGDNLMQLKQPPAAEPVETVVNGRTRPNGAADCSHG
jgi:hypothetical protein